MTTSQGKENHRMLSVRRDFKDHLFPSHPGHLPLDQVAQSPIQPDLDYIEGGGIHNVSEQPVPASNFTVKNFFLTSNLNIFSFTLKTLP